MLPAKKTRQKFYNKYLYKTTLFAPGITIVRTIGKDPVEVEKYLNTVDVNSIRWARSTTASAITNKELIVDLLYYLSSLDKDQVHLRMENNCVDLYTNNVETYDFVNNKFEESLIHRFEPDSDVIDTIKNENVMICTKLPKDRYNYRVYLRPHVLANKYDEKERFLKFLYSLGKAVSITPAVTSWFMKTDWNWDRRYILVENEHTLLMLKLRNSDLIGKVTRFVIPINTACPQKA